MDVYSKMRQLGIELPKAPAKGGAYSQCKVVADRFVLISGCGPIIGDKKIQGKIGDEYTSEEGQVFARNCILNILAVLEDCIGDLNKVKNVVKILVFVASHVDFYAQPQVADGASTLLVKLYGEDIGVPARSAVGMYVLPGNIPVEIEALFEVDFS